MATASGGHQNRGPSPRKRSAYRAPMEAADVICARLRKPKILRRCCRAGGAHHVRYLALRSAHLRRVGDAGGARVGFVGERPRRAPVSSRPHAK